jgi:hypothetical protein
MKVNFTPISKLIMSLSARNHRMFVDSGAADGAAGIGNTGAECGVSNTASRPVKHTCGTGGTRLCAIFPRFFSGNENRHG